MKVVKEKNGDVSVIDDGNDLVFGFNQFSKNHYYDILKDKFDYIDNIHIGNYHYLDGGCQYEFRVEWKLLGKDVVAFVQLFDDAWKFMDQILPVIDMLKSFDGRTPTPNEFADKLIALGLVDLSKSVDKDREIPET